MELTEEEIRMIEQQASERQCECEEGEENE